MDYIYAQFNIAEFTDQINRMRADIGFDSTFDLLFMNYIKIVLKTNNNALHIVITITFTLLLITKILRFEVYEKC